MRHLRSHGHRVLQKLMTESRIATGLNQIDFAARLRWQKSVVERIEAGHQIPTYLEVRDWAIACGLTPAQFNYRFDMRMKRHP